MKIKQTRGQSAGKDARTTQGGLVTLSVSSLSITLRDYTLGRINLKNLIKEQHMTLSDDWIVGFVDGEGCFSVGQSKNSKLRFGHQIQAEFTVVQHVRDIQLLHKLKKHFGCGSVAQNHGDRYHYRVKNLEHLLTIIIPFFEKHKLQTNKRHQLTVFKEICLGLEAKKHFTKEGYDELLKLKQRLSDLKKVSNRNRLDS